MLLITALSAFALLAGPTMPHTRVLGHSAAAGVALLRTPLRTPQLQQRSRVVVALQGPPPDPPGDEDAEDRLTDAYRLLGIPRGADYDMITDAHIELTEKYADDPARVQKYDNAKDIVVNEQLRRRMSGELRAKVADSPWDEKPVVREMPWVPVLLFLKNFIAVPNVGHVKACLPLMTMLLVMPWISPKVVGSVQLVNCLAGLAFTYNRGQGDVVRDEWGQIGEIRPFVRKPMLITMGCCFFTYHFTAFLAKSFFAGLVGAPRGTDKLLKASFLSIGLLIQVLFIRVHNV